MAMGCDHAGCAVKAHLAADLRELGHHVIDVRLFKHISWLSSNVMMCMRGVMRFSPVRAVIS
jgi:ribose 5-phosphate isomerase RpiB